MMTSQPDNPKKTNNSKRALGDLILEAVKTAYPNWVDRKQIAAAIGRPDGKSRPNDNEKLEELVVAGLIEKKDEKIGAAGTKYLYRYNNAASPNPVKE